MRRDQFLKAMAALAATGAVPHSVLAAGANLKMMIPANPGGGWDGRRRALPPAQRQRHRRRLGLLLPRHAATARARPCPFALAARSSLLSFCWLDRQ